MRCMMPAACGRLAHVSGGLARSFSHLDHCDPQDMIFAECGERSAMAGQAVSSTRRYGLGIPARAGWRRRIGARSSAGRRTGSAGGREQADAGTVPVEIRDGERGCRLLPGEVQSRGAGI